MKQLAALLLTCIIILLSTIIPYDFGRIINIHFLDIKIDSVILLWFIGVFGLVLTLSAILSIIAIYNEILDNIK